MLNKLGEFAINISYLRYRRADFNNIQQRLINYKNCAPRRAIASKFGMVFDSKQINRLQIPLQK